MRLREELGGIGRNLDAPDQEFLVCSSAETGSGVGQSAQRLRDCPGHRQWPCTLQRPVARHSIKQESERCHGGNARPAARIQAEVVQSSKVQSKTTSRDRRSTLTIGHPSEHGYGFLHHANLLQFRRICTSVLVLAAEAADVPPGDSWMTRSVRSSRRLST